MLSERCAWAAQNFVGECRNRSCCIDFTRPLTGPLTRPLTGPLTRPLPLVGAILPMLFVVVDELRFTGSCVAILFYGVSSQAFSIDRSIGGRVFGALLWTGAFLMGGILAFAMTSLAWVARGAGVVGVMTVPASEQGSLPTVSATYYILVMVFHVVCSFFMSRPRAMEAGFMETARGTLSHGGY